VKLDFYDYRHELEFRDRPALTRRLEAHAERARAAGAPLYLYSAGTGRPSFEHGGREWARDVLLFARERGISFAYRAYRGDDYGLYADGDGPVDPASMNSSLAELFGELSP